LDEQRALVREVARERKYRQAGWCYRVEELDGEANDWPVLQKVLEIAENNEDRNGLAVIPTLDGVQFNLSFLDLLDGDRTVYVRSGWRWPKRFGEDPTYMRRAVSLGWLLSIDDERRDFAKLVDRVRDRNYRLRRSIREGLKEAAERGIRLGSRRPGSHQLTTADRKKGGRVTAKQRQLSANARYHTWINDMRMWRANGDSIGKITLKLAEKQVTKPDGGSIGRMLVYRILKRAVETPI
jgi:hypothetical protein